MRLIDLRHLGRERVIGSWLVGEVLIDPGPSTCLETLLDALDGTAPRAIALTHIHLDHAGATGVLARRFPEVEVWVHERGAPHLIDPSKLLASATRLYGDDMERLWGEVAPVPSERVRVLRGGERLGGPGGSELFQVAYTPGHASHHVAYLHEPTGTAFCGDVAGVRIDAAGPVLAPTPPPDIDIPAWRSSLERIEAWQPSALVPTHFGRYEDVAEHLSALRASLSDTERLVREGDLAGFIAAEREQVKAAGVAPEIASAYEQAMPFDQAYAGMRRYLEKVSAEPQPAAPPH
jgi:glyoxylase-like metal-dependent hydrolase (beta-lactamase superfamily II)